MSLTNSIASAGVNLATTEWAFRNRIINGNCNIAQRPSFAYTAGLSGYGGPDRFFAVNIGTAGGQFTQSQGTITYNGVMKNAVVQTVNTAITSTTTTNYWSGISQAIEGLNCYSLLGLPVVLSFIFSTNITGTYSVAISDYTRANSWVQTFMATAGTPTKVMIPVSVLPLTLTTPNTNAGGLWLNIGAVNTGTYQTANLGTWQTGEFLTASTATNWGTTANNFIALTEPQIEAGLTSTPFENRSATVELALCQRYYQTMYTGMATYGSAGGGIGYNQEYATTMRAIPTSMLLSGPTQYSNCTTFTLVYPEISSAFAEATATNLGLAYYFNAYFGLSAEL